ncbi:MAG: ATP-binding protein [Acidobacteria bacterium]|nr:ATP-binding protein [Acidobacteriota bacterium]MYK89552.1 ATP-binding protein [Acidobacteriota bacterium]
MRFFNTEGPVRSDDHYLIPPLDRVNLDALLGLVRDKRYFVLHAPRQTGKTSALLALRDLLNSGAAGDYRCVYADVEAAQALREDVAESMRAVLSELALQASLTLGEETLEGIWPGALERAGPGQALRHALLRWCMADPRPLVLLIDEIDTLVGDTLLSVLRQLRAGYPDRPRRFPHSVILCGVRDVRDYRIHSTAQNALVLGGSAFNIKSKSLRLGDFTEAETRSLLVQHTTETGQAFTEGAFEAVRARSAGQPWLVNALCREACFESETGRDRTRAITADDILDAQERLILRRDTHIDDLANKLREERVRRVVEPILAGTSESAWSSEDVAYAHDLGLVALDADGTPRIANPIYAEVVPRHLSHAVQMGLPQRMAWYVDGDGGLDVAGLIEAFQAFFREHSEHWVQRFEKYHEAGPQLLLQACLQRVVNGGGRIEREYALGRGRTDLLILWPQGGRTRRFVIECKVLHTDPERTIAEGVAQTRGYMDRCGAESGHLIVFDRASDRTWEEKIFRRDTPSGAGGAPVTVWGM